MKEPYSSGNCWVSRETTERFDSSRGMGSEGSGHNDGFGISGDWCACGRGGLLPEGHSGDQKQIEKRNKKASYHPFPFGPKSLDRRVISVSYKPSRGAILGLRGLGGERQERCFRLGRQSQGYIAQGRDPKSNLVLNRFRYNIATTGELYSDEKTQVFGLPDYPR